jgi:hypothetical protein
VEKVSVLAGLCFATRIEAATTTMVMCQQRSGVKNRVWPSRKKRFGRMGQVWSLGVLRLRCAPLRIRSDNCGWTKFAGGACAGGDFTRSCVGYYRLAPTHLKGRNDDG